jgi:hypothetical protein
LPGYIIVWVAPEANKQYRFSGFPGEENTYAADSDVGGIFSAKKQARIANILLTALAYATGNQIGRD